MLTHHFPRYSQGVSLIEIMVALVAGLTLMAGVIAMSASILKNCMSASKMTQLNYELQSAMTLMTNEIRRAGYWGNAASALGTNVNSNPFMASVANVSTNAASNCILFTYDSDSNNSLSTTNTANTNEHFGYRLQNGVIQGLTSDANFSCTSNAPAWQSLTNANIVNITNLKFNLIVTPVTVTGLPTSPNITVRSVTIIITGQLASDSTVTKTLTETVHIRNDLYVP